MRRCRPSSKFRMKRRIPCLCKWISGWCATRTANCSRSSSNYRPSLPSTRISRLWRRPTSTCTDFRTSGFGLPASGRLKYFLSGLDTSSYRELLRRAIVGSHDPENVILMEIDPLHQKTLPDFLLTEKMLGVRTVDIVDIKKDGSRLYYERMGKRIPIRADLQPRHRR